RGDLGGVEEHGVHGGASRRVSGARGDGNVDDAMRLVPSDSFEFGSAEHVPLNTIGKPRGVMRLSGLLLLGWGLMSSAPAPAQTTKPTNIVGLWVGTMNAWDLRSLL